MICPLGMLIRGTLCHKVGKLADESCEAPGAGLGPKQGSEKYQLSPLRSLGFSGDAQLPLPFQLSWKLQLVREGHPAQGHVP